MSKADNLLSILWLLKTRKQMTAKQIAEELEMNIRTVYRYIDSLCASGVPIIADSGHNGGYTLLEQFNDVPLFFNLQEQKALIHAAKFAQEAGYPFGAALEEAISKLKRYTNQEQLNAINRHSIGFEIIHPPTNSSIETTLHQLEEAVANEQTLLMEYAKGYENTFTTRHIDPYGVLFWKNRWYLVGFCHLRSEIRSFRVDRIHDISITNQNFKRPLNFSARHFFLKGIIPDPQDATNSISIRITGEKSAIDDLCQHWLLSHVLMERSQTEVQFILDKEMISFYLPYLILSYGKSIKVLEPLFLREKLMEITSELQKFYQSS